MHFYVAIDVSQYAIGVEHYHLDEKGVKHPPEKSVLCGDLFHEILSESHLWCSKVWMLTDHAALIWLTNFKESDHRDAKLFAMDISACVWKWHVILDSLSPIYTKCQYENCLQCLQIEKL